MRTRNRSYSAVRRSSINRNDITWTTTTSSQPNSAIGTARMTITHTSGQARGRGPRKPRRSAPRRRPRRRTYVCTIRFVATPPANRARYGRSSPATGRRLSTRRRTGPTLRTVRRRRHGAHPACSCASTSRACRPPSASSSSCVGLGQPPWSSTRMVRSAPSTAVGDDHGRPASQARRSSPGSPPRSRRRRWTSPRPGSGSGRPSTRRGRSRSAAAHRPTGGTRAPRRRCPPFGQRRDERRGARRPSASPRSSSVAAGRVSRRFPATVSWNRKVSCGTSPIVRRSSRIHLAEVRAADPDRPASGSANRSRSEASVVLPAPTADDGHRLAGPDREAHVLERGRIARSVPERHVLDDDAGPAGSTGSRPAAVRPARSRAPRTRARTSTCPTPPGASPR